MLVKDLRKLVNETPDGITQEAFDNLEVLVYAKDGELYNPAIEQSGLVTFSGFVEKRDGEWVDIPDPEGESKIDAFALFPNEELEVSGE